MLECTVAWNTNRIIGWKADYKGVLRLPRKGRDGLAILRVVKIEGGGGREVLHFFKYSENLNLRIFRVKIYKFSKELNLPRK